MERPGRTVRGALTTLICISMLVWSVLPSINHAPSVFDVIQDHQEMVAEHGHSHGMAEDLYWAIHGHSHDMADHDHSAAYLSARSLPEPSESSRNVWRSPTKTGFAEHLFRIERPPRA